MRTDKREKGCCWHHMKGQFGESGLRMTQAREVILTVLGHMKDHASAEDIYMAAHKIYPRVGLTTVYRTLDILCRMGAIAKVEFGDGRARFELSESQGAKAHHHHLVCTRCGTIIDYSDFSEKEKQCICAMQKELEERYHFRIQHHSVQYYGICKKCEMKQ